MVAKKNINNKRYALISTFNKEEVISLCKIFLSYNIEILSTGLTHKHILMHGFKSTNISSHTGFKEILDGRVKTLHPNIHASLLYDRNNKSHSKIFKKLNFPKIDFVIVNLYPFKNFINKKNSKEKIIENAKVFLGAILKKVLK